MQDRTDPGCSNARHRLGLDYPRTCRKCGLGPCWYAGENSVPPGQRTTPADPAAALEWAIIARQREIGRGASVTFDMLEADPIWLALVKLSKEATDGKR